MKRTRLNSIRLSAFDLADVGVVDLKKIGNRTVGFYDTRVNLSHRKLVELFHYLSKDQ